MKSEAQKVSDFFYECTISCQAEFVEAHKQDVFLKNPNFPKTNIELINTKHYEILQSILVRFQCYKYTAGIIIKTMMNLKIIYETGSYQRPKNKRST